MIGVELGMVRSARLTGELRARLCRANAIVGRGVREWSKMSHWSQLWVLPLRVLVAEEGAGS